MPLNSIRSPSALSLNPYPQPPNMSTQHLHSIPFPPPPLSFSSHIPQYSKPPSYPALPDTRVPCRYAYSVFTRRPLLNLDKTCPFGADARSPGHDTALIMYGDGDVMWKGRRAGFLVAVWRIQGVWILGWWFHGVLWRWW